MSQRSAVHHQQEKHQLILVLLSLDESEPRGMMGMSEGEWWMVSSFLPDACKASQSAVGRGQSLLLKLFLLESSVYG